jgi:hypothetical protein
VTATPLPTVSTDALTAGAIAAAGQSLEIHDQPPFAVGQNPVINNGPPQVMKPSYAWSLAR